MCVHKVGSVGRPPLCFLDKGSILDRVERSWEAGAVQFGQARDAYYDEAKQGCTRR